MKISIWNLAHVITSWTSPTTQLLGQISPVGASPKQGKYNTCDFFVILSFFSSRAQVKTLHQFLRWMAQTTWFRPKTVLLGVRTMGDVIWGNMPQKGVNRQFQAKTPKSITRNISGTINLTNKWFEDRVQTTKGTSWVVRHYSKANTTWLAAAILKIDMTSWRTFVFRNRK